MKVKEIISLVLICTMTLVLGTTTFALERSEPTGIASSDPFSSDRCCLLYTSRKSSAVSQEPPCAISSMRKVFSRRHFIIIKSIAISTGF